ncbi:MAG: flippase-like domain-containing protein [Proteobacteria bacterium]|jgi:hypothetical protein|nr:flippase-like domain-containing protein [Pseudomonadota bacterium]
MTSSKRSTAAKIVVLALSFGLLGYVLWQIGWDQVVLYVGRIGALAGLGLIAVGYLENFCDSQALRAGLGPGAPRLKTLFIAQAGSFVNMFIPFDGGEVFKATMLRKIVDSKSAFTGIILWNYLAKLTKSVAILGTSCVAWLCAGDAGAKSIAGMLVLLSILSFSMFLIFKLVLLFGATEKIARILVKLRLLRRSPEELVAKARDIDQTVRHFYTRERGRYLAILGWQMAARVVNFFTLWFLIATLGGEGFQEALVAYSTFGLTTFITLLFPNRIGVDEGAGYVVFKMVGLDPTLGAMLQFVVRLRNVVVNGTALPVALGFSKRAQDGAGEEAP